MLPQCLQAITQAAGRSLTTTEVSGIEERMLGAMQSIARKDPVAWRSLSTEERYAQAGKLARSRYNEDIAASQARTVRDMHIKARELKKVDSFKPGAQGQLAALRQRLTMQGNYKGRDIGLDAQIKAVHADFTRQLDGGAQKGRFWGLVQNPAEQHNLVRAIFGDRTGNPEHDAIGKQVRDVLEQARTTADDAGVHINHLDNWHLPQPWAWEKVGANREQFVKDMMAEIDPSGYVRKDGTPMTTEEIRKTVEASAETLGTNGANKRGEDMRGGYGGSVGASRNAPRQLHFKDSGGYIRMMDKYGSANNVMAMLDHHFHGLARDIATARTYGRDADRFVPQLIDRAFAADAQSGLNEKQLKQLESLKLRTTKEYQALRSPGSPGSLPLWAQVSNVTRSIIGSTMLGGSTLAAIPDLAMSTAYGREIGLTKKAVLGNTLEGFKPTKVNLEYIRRLGITAQTMQEGTQRFGAGELSNQFTRFLNHGVHVLSLLRMWDRMMTHGVSASLMDMLGKNVSEHNFSDLRPEEQEYLRSRGVTPDHYATWQQAELEGGPHGNHTMLTPDSIYAIPDDKLRPIAEQKMAGVSDAFKADAAKRAERTATENDWLAKRLTKFDELRQHVRDTLAQMQAKGSIKEGRAQGLADARAEQLRASVERAEVETDIGRYLKTQGAQDHAHAFLEAVEEGAAVERQTVRERVHPDNRTDAVVETTSKQPAAGEKMNALIQRYGREVGAKAEALGKRQGKAEARIAEAQRNVDQLGRDNKAALDEKSKQFAMQMDRRLTEIREFTKGSRERAVRRAELDDLFQKQHGVELDRTIRNLRSEAAQHLLAMTISESQIGARGGAGNSVRDNVALHVTPDNADTYMGQAVRWLLFLKQTPLGIFRTHMLDVPGSMNDWKSAWSYRARFMAASASLGALGLVLKTIALGQDPENLATPEGAAKVAIASGGFGMYGDFLFGDSAEHQNNGFVKMLGPGATALQDMYDMYTRSKNELTDDAGTKQGQYAAKLLQFARNYAMPFTRLWYLKAAFNHMVYQQQMEKLVPGYNARIRQRMARKGQSSWWNPGEMEPNRAPNVGAAVGQPTPQK